MILLKNEIISAKTISKIVFSYLVTILIACLSISFEE